MKVGVCVGGWVGGGGDGVRLFPSEKENNTVEGWGGKIKKANEKNKDKVMIFFHFKEKTFICHFFLPRKINVGKKADEGCWEVVWTSLRHIH